METISKILLKMPHKFQKDYKRYHITLILNLDQNPNYFKISILDPLLKKNYQGLYIYQKLDNIFYQHFNQIDQVYSLIYQSLIYQDDYFKLEQQGKLKIGYLHPRKKLIQYLDLNTEQKEWKQKCIKQMDYLINPQDHMSKDIQIQILKAQIEKFKQQCFKQIQKFRKQYEQEENLEVQNLQRRMKLQIKALNQNIKLMNQKINKSFVQRKDQTTQLVAKINNQNTIIKDLQDKLKKQIIQTQNEIIKKLEDKLKKQRIQTRNQVSQIDIKINQLSSSINQIKEIKQISIKIKQLNQKFQFHQKKYNKESQDKFAKLEESIKNIKIDFIQNQKKIEDKIQETTKITSCLPQSNQQFIQNQVTTSYQNNESTFQQKIAQSVDIIDKFVKQAQLEIGYIEQDKQIRRINHPSELEKQAKIEFQTNHNFYKSLKIYKKCLNLYVSKYGRFSFQSTSILHQIGVSLDSLGQYQSALECFQKCKIIYETILGKNNMSYAKILVSIGNTKESQLEYAFALKNYKEALKIKQQIEGQQSSKCLQLINIIGSIYTHHIKDLDEAANIYQKGLNITLNKYGQNSFENTFYLNKLGNSIYYSKGKKSNKALGKALLQKSVQIMKRNNKKDNEKLKKSLQYAQTLRYVGIIHFQEGKKEQALKNFEECKLVYEKVAGKKIQIWQFKDICERINKLKEDLQKNEDECF